MTQYWKTLQEQFSLFLVSENRVPPLLLFLQIGYLTLFGVLQYSPIIFIGALFISLLEKNNYFWFIGILIQPGLGYFGIINLILGLISCNQRWKFLLFTFIVVFFLTFKDQKLHYALNIVVLLALSIQTYSKLPFKTIQDNRDYFVGFSCLLVYFSFNLFISLSNLEWDQLIYSSIFLMVSISILAYHIMKRKFWTFSNSNFQQIDNPNKVYHYLSTIKERSKDTLQKIGIQNIHKLNCNQPDCFCKIKSKLSFQRLYIRKLSKMALKKFNTFEFRQALQQSYINQLLEDNMFPLAVQTVLKQNNYKWDIFKQVRIRRVKNSLNKRLAHIQSSYQWKTVFQDPFEYQRNFQDLRRYILQLISLKIQFWSEILKKITIAKKLKKLGKQFLYKLNKMNIFYLSSIQPVQKQIKIHSGAILYNLFLLITTNYKETAEANIKALKKNNDPRQRRTYRLGIIKCSLSKDRMAIIQNLNNNCAKMIGPNLSKVDYLGKKIFELVPRSYLQQHTTGMKNLHQFNSRTLVGSELDSVLVVCGNNRIISCGIFLKFSPNIFSELSIISLLKYQKQDIQYILLDGEGNPEYTSDEKVDVDIIHSKQVSKVIQQIKNQWRGVNNDSPIYPLPQEVKIQIKYKDSDYICIVSSPLCQSFRYPKKPPIHISIKNETKTYYHEDQLGQQGDVGALKKIQVILDQNETQSQTSSMSRRSSIIQIFKMFQSNSGLQLFQYFYIVMVLIFIFLAACFTIQYLFTDIPWLKVGSDQSNSIKLFETHYEIQYWISGFVNKGMSLYGINRGTITDGGYTGSYGSSGSYSTATLIQIGNMCSILSKLVQQKQNLNNAAGSQYYSIMRKQMNLANSSGNSLMFHNLINLAVSNCYQMAKGIDFWRVATFNYFWSNIFPNYVKLFKALKDNMMREFDYYLMLCYVVFSIFSIGLILSLIPIYFGNKRIQSQQNYIFDLMTSISFDLIQEEILQLSDLQMSLKSNYSGTFNFDQKQSSKLKNQHSYDEKSEIKTEGMTDTRRRRYGQLDTKGNNNIKLCLYIIVISFGVFLSALFIVRINYITSVKSDFNTISNLKKWRNQRLEQLINIKKLVYELRPNELIIGQQLSDRIRRIFAQRRQNYPFGDSIQQTPINCTVSTAICKNGTVSQLSINVFLFQLMIETFVSKNPQHLGLIAVLKDISKDFNDGKTKIIDDKIQNARKTTNQNVNTIFMTGLIYLLIASVLTITYLRFVRIQHMALSRFITFLSDDMIKKNKRVESYLQKLMKSE